MLDLRDLTTEALASCGQIFAPLRTRGQGVETRYNPQASPTEANLVPSSGELRLSIMHLPHVGLGFRQTARHHQVTPCLRSLGGNEWPIGVAPSDDLNDPRLEDIVTFRRPGDRVIKLHVATWHAGPHFVHYECQFVNPANLDINRHAVPLPPNAATGPEPTRGKLPAQPHHPSSAKG